METPNFDKIQSMLPSKKFSLVLGSCVIGVFAIILITSKIGSLSNFNDGAATNGGLISSSGTVGDITSRDSNNNGIPDWEESLWGLDPTADGPTNKAIIDAKKAANNIPTTDDSSQTLTATDKFSRNFLSTILALKQSGNLTPEAIANLAASIGDSVDAKHANPNTYTLSDINTVANSTEAKTTYKNALKKIIDQYANLDLGSELTVIANGLSGGGAETLALLDPEAQAYTNIAKQIIALPTPDSAAPDALVLANTSAEMGVTLGEVEHLYDDVLTGMVGLDDYIKASNASDAGVVDMRAYFAQ